MGEIAESASGHFDVAVVGFGPSGAVATGLLGKAGLKVLTIDRSRTVYDKPRAIALDHEIMRVFQQLGLADKVAPYVAPFPASEYYGVDGQLIRRIDAVPPPFPLGYTPTLVFTQPPVEDLLRELAASHPSVAIWLGAELVEISQSEETATLRVRHDDGTMRRITADYVIGCDGASSTVRQQVGITLEDLNFDEPWLVVDVRVNERGLAKLPKVAIQNCNPARPSTFIIGPGNHRRWEIMLSPGDDPQRVAQDSEVWKLLSPWLTPDDATLWRAASYRFHALVAREWRRGRVFIAGDAAHQQPPFIGQGMCQGIRDVVNLSWKLIEVHRGRADDGLLDSYGVERVAHVVQLTTRIKDIGKVICERDTKAARTRDAKLLEEGGGQARTITRQEIVPPLQTGLLSNIPDLANGTLFPQPWIKHNSGRILLDSVVGNGWRLVLDGRHSQVSDLPALLESQPSLKPILVLQSDATSDALGQAHPSVETVVETEGVLARWFEDRQCVAAIVRPDNYVYGVAARRESLQDILIELSSRISVHCRLNA
jgi:3-(3-hydroxy-phenyl)propionate hydroxylase